MLWARKYDLEFIDVRRRSFIFSSDKGFQSPRDMKAIQLFLSYNVSRPAAPNISSYYFLNTSGDEAAYAEGHCGVRKPKRPFYIAVTPRGPLGVRKGSCVKRNLFTLSAYPLTDCSADMQEQFLS